MVCGAWSTSGHGRVRGVGVTVDGTRIDETRADGRPEMELCGEHLERFLLGLQRVLGELLREEGELRRVRALIPE
jgi:hypothetical protein